jgi:hypothetical protein
MEEADVQPVDLGDELRHGVEPRLALAPIIFCCPVARGLICTGLTAHPPARESHRCGRSRVRRTESVGTLVIFSLECEQVVTKKAVRLHCHSVPRSGSYTTRGRPTYEAAPAAAIATAAIASVLRLRQRDFMSLSFSR